MNLSVKKGYVVFAAAVLALISVSAVLAFQASSIPASRLINPEELIKILQSPKGEKPLMIQVVSHVLYEQAHIPGSEYIGPASYDIGLQQLRNRVQALPRTKFIVIYCGCCHGAIVRTSSLPTTHCARWVLPR